MQEKNAPCAAQKPGAGHFIAAGRRCDAVFPLLSAGRRAKAAAATHRPAGAAPPFSPGRPA